MGIKVLVVSSNIALWDYMDRNRVYTYKYIGHIGEYFSLEEDKIKGARIKQFLYISIVANTIFNIKQVKKLNGEIKTLEELDMNSEMIGIIKKGIAMIMDDNDLYLKFECD